ncbi:MAG: arginyltransferase [Spirochaetales bacterium]|nr:arginyltransferase [Spirochaetales bacterium]
MNETLTLHETPGDECPYLPGRVWKTEFFTVAACPEGVYEFLLAQGFRRSGLIFYRNICPDCEECRQIRIPVSRFAPTRSQARAVRKNRDVQVSIAPAGFRKDVFALYRRYSAFKHEKDTEDEKSFRRFLCDSPLDTRMTLYRIDGALAAAGWVDVLPGGLSSVYFAFEPDFARRSLGVFSVVKEIELAKDMGLPFYYLGFVVDGSPKMGYKAAYCPQQRLYGGVWCNWP